jgi:glycogen synthase
MPVIKQILQPTAKFYFSSVLYCCGHLMQVSDTYSKEVSGHGSIAPHYFKFHGIRNGIDSDIWDPYNDNFIPVQ